MYRKNFKSSIFDIKKESEINYKKNIDTVKSFNYVSLLNEKNDYNYIEFIIYVKNDKNINIITCNEYSKYILQLLCMYNRLLLFKSKFHIYKNINHDISEFPDIYIKYLYNILPFEMLIRSEKITLPDTIPDFLYFKKLISSCGYNMSKIDNCVHIGVKDFKMGLNIDKLDIEKLGFEYLYNMYKKITLSFSDYDNMVKMKANMYLKKIRYLNYIKSSKKCDNDKFYIYNIVHDLCSYCFLNISITSIPCGHKFVCCKCIILVNNKTCLFCNNFIIGYDF